jgi:hypothetical protein
MKFSLDCALIMVVYGTHIKLNWYQVWIYYK